MLGKNMLEMHNALNAPRASIVDDKWVRPESWIDLSDCPEGSIYMMVAGMPESEMQLNFSVTAVQAYSGGEINRFIIDWGDGIVEEYSSGHSMRHTYAKGTGEWIGEYYFGILVKITPKTSDSGNQIKSFKVVTNEIMTVPHYSNIVSIFLNCPYMDSLEKAFGINLAKNYYSQMLREVIIHKCKSTLIANEAFFGCYNLEKFSIPEVTKVLDCGYMFYDCKELSDINIFDTSLSSNFYYMFKSCSSLKKILPFNLSNATTIANMYQYCILITEIPEGFITSHIQGFTSCFDGCASLSDISNLDLSAATNTAYMFRATAITNVDMTLPYSTNVSYMFTLCTQLKYIKKFEAPLATSITSVFSKCDALVNVESFLCPLAASANYIFENCFSLVEIFELDLSSATNLAYAFSNCYSLKYIPEIILSKVTTLGYTFNNCYQLKNISLIVENPTLLALSSTFYNCYSLQSVPNMNTTKVTSFQQCFYECRSLTLIPQYSYASVSSGGLFDIVKGCSNLGGVLDFSSCTILYTSSGLDVSYTKIIGLIPPTQIKHLVNVSGTLMDATALNTLFSALPTAGTSYKTLNIKQTPGGATCDTTIATSKGWIMIVD